MTKIRVLLADDHALVRAGIRSLLESQSDMEVVGEAADGREALEIAREIRPDLVVMDIAMPGVGGLEAARRIKAEFPEVRILILTMLEDDRYFFQAICAGTSGFIVKGALPVDFLSAVRAVAQGQVYLYPSLARKLVDEYLSQARTEQGRIAADGLTERELQVLALISEGRTGKEMGKTLGISPHTVERHRQNLMAKLDLHNRAELIHYAIRKGLLERDA
jgi:two-component system, NarL family, response regulator NreC